MSETTSVRLSKSKRTSIIAIAILVLVTVVFLAYQKMFDGIGLKPPFQSAAPGDVKPAASTGPESKQGAAPQAGTGGKPAPTASAGKAPPSIPVKVAQVKETIMTDSVTAVGSLLAQESVVIRPEIAGRVTKIHFNEGQEVNAGAPLLSIDPAELSAQLAQGTADVHLNQQRYSRAQDMYKQSFMSRQALDEANSNLERASAGKQEILARLAKTEIRAPFKGVLGLRKISAGAYMKPGDDIVTLEDLSALKLDFRVPEMFLSKLKTGQELTIRVDAYPGASFSGKIYAFEPGVDERTRTIVVRAGIPNSEAKLRSGMFARVDVLLATRPIALVVPEQAIWPQGKDVFVYKVADGKAALTKIELGVRRPGEVEVVKGLSAKDMVVTDGQLKLRDGAAVTVMSAQPKAANVAPAAKAGG